MIRAGPTFPHNASIRTLLEQDTAAYILRSAARIDWPDGALPADVRVERAWPLRDDRFAIEWSFALAGAGGRADKGDGRHSLHGVWDGNATPQVDAPSERVEVTPEGLRGLLVALPEWKLRLHSPDCDPELPHLAGCFNRQGMAARLRTSRAILSRSEHSSPKEIEYRLLGYRAGRRAAIAYHEVSTDDRRQ